MTTCSSLLSKDIPPNDQSPIPQCPVSVFFGFGLNDDSLPRTGPSWPLANARAVKDLCAGVTWMQRVPPALLASYRALYVILRGDAAAAEDEINRCVVRVFSSSFCVSGKNAKIEQG